MRDAVSHGLGSQYVVYGGDGKCIDRMRAIVLEIGR